MFNNNMDYYTYVFAQCKIYIVERTASKDVSRVDEHFQFVIQGFFGFNIPVYNVF